MAKPADDHVEFLRSAEVRQALRRYAEQLVAVFSQMGRLSDTGIKCSRSQHTPATVLEIPGPQRAGTEVSEAELVGGEGVFDQERGKSRESRPAMKEMEFIEAWLQRDPTPLLIRSEFGCGKSILMESVSVSLAKRLLRDDTYAEGEFPPGVPLPVRLRAWKWFEDEGFEEFLVRSQSLLTDPPILLNQKHVHALRSLGLLVPLFDGLDELPGPFENRQSGVSIRERALSHIRYFANATKPCRFIVASRPGYEADRDAMFGSTNRIEIQDLSESECAEYIQKHFASGPSRRLVLKAFEQARSSLGMLLAKPLFLAAWCGRAEQCLFASKNTSPAREFPMTNVPDLMQALMVNAFAPSRIRQWLAQPTEQAELFKHKRLTASMLQELRPIFAAMFFTFAQSGFREPVVKQDFKSAKLYLLAPEHRKQIDWALFLAERAGLIHPLQEGEWLPIKVPLTEYFAGVHLAGLAAGTEDQQRLFIAVFRRWAWQPELHEALFFAFAVLQAGTAQQQQLASECVDWLLTIGDCCLLNTMVTPESVILRPIAQDDLLCPLAILASRLAPKHARIIPALIQARRRRDAYHRNAYIPLLARIHPELVDPYIRAFVEDWTALPLTDEDSIESALAQAAARLPTWNIKSFLDQVLIPVKDNGVPDVAVYSAIDVAISRFADDQIVPAMTAWLAALKDKSGMQAMTLAWAIETVAERIPEKVAERCIQDLLATLKGKSGLVAEAMARAIRRTAERIPETLAGACTNTLLGALEGKTELMIEALLPAVSSAAKRLPRTGVEIRVHDWLASLEGKSDQAALGLEAAIFAAAGEIPDADAERCCKNWRAELQGKSGTMARGLWGAISQAAWRLPETVAENLIKDWLAASKRKTSVEAKALRHAATIACSRIPEAATKRCIADLLVALEDESGPAALMLEWGIRFAVDRIPKPAIQDCIQDWLKALKGTTGPLAEALAQAIARAAARIPRSAVEGCIEDLFAALEGRSGLTAERLVVAVRFAAERIPEGVAEDCIQRWFAKLEGRSGPVADALQHAIQFSAKRMPEAVAENNIQNWLSALEGQSGPAAESLAGVIRVAAGRIAAENARRDFDICRSFNESKHQRTAEISEEAMWTAAPRMHATDAFELAQQLMSKGDYQSALAIASFQPSLAARLSALDPPNRTPVYEFFSRSDEQLILDDDDLSHAPERLRQLAARRASPEEQYELLRKVLSAAVSGQSVQLPAWHFADRHTRKSAARVWALAGKKLEIRWPADPNHDRPHYLLVKIAEKPSLLTECWQEGKVDTTSRAMVQEGALTSSAGKDENRAHRAERLYSKDVQKLVHDATRDLTLSVQEKSNINEWLAKGKNTTDKVREIVDAMNRADDAGPKVTRVQDPRNNRYYVLASGFVSRLSQEAALKAIAARAKIWKDLSIADPRSISDEDLTNKVSLCEGCGHINHLIRPGKGRLHVQTPCPYCKTALSNVNIDERPEFYRTCPGANCRSEKPAMFAFPPPENGWTKMPGRKKDNCPRCDTKLSRAKPTDQREA